MGVTIHARDGSSILPGPFFVSATYAFAMRETDYHTGAPCRIGQIQDILNFQAPEFTGGSL
jgi:hypothetical protein